jgi:lysine decarboxylase
MTNYVNDGTIPYHTPGHKQGKGVHPRLESILGRPTLALDLALMPELDDLHEPHGPIKAAQDLAAELYGSDHSFFTVNGTTGGIYAMILTVAGPGDKIIVPRNAHRSIIGGIILAGASPVFMHPEVDRDLGIAMGVTPQAVEDAVHQHPDAKGVLIINPTYYGVATDLRQIVDIVHDHNMPVVVDEAHGPHLHFSERLPLQALDAGADICAQSTHKIIGALTQCSIVHCREGRISVPRLKAMLQLVQSTSPNYILMASLDVARMQMATEGRQLIEKAIDLAEWVREEINKVPGLYCFGREKLGKPGVFGFDPTKVTVTVKGLGLKGAEAERILRHKYKVQAELSDMYNLYPVLPAAAGRRPAYLRAGGLYAENG